MTTMAQVFELLRDPVWTAAGTALAVLSVMATFMVYRLQRQRRSLSYLEVSKNDLLTSWEEHDDRLQILYEGQPMKDIVLLVLRISNDGNTPIAASEFERPLAICVAEPARVLNAAVLIRRPKQLAITFSEAAGKLIIDPVLLNPGDTFTFKVLLADSRGHYAVDARVLGVRNIAKTLPPSGLLDFIQGLSIQLVVFALVAWLDQSGWLQRPMWQASLNLFGLVLLIGSLLMLRGLYRFARTRHTYRMES